jgi:hypothetical protein
MSAPTTLERRALGVAPHEHAEGTITKLIESCTSAVPSGTDLSLAVGAIGLSAIPKLAGRNQGAQFVGHLVPTLLILGLYNKLVKVQGSE